MENELLNSDSEGQDSEWDISASRVIQAIEEDKFCLYCQVIVPMKQSDNMCTHHEILIRMSEEEDNLIPPGTFLPFVEKYKMMPRLDRWVVRHVLQWLSSHQLPSGSLFFINVAKDTLCDPVFPDFVRVELQQTGISAEMQRIRVLTRNAHKESLSNKSLRSFRALFHELQTSIPETSEQNDTAIK